MTVPVRPPGSVRWLTTYADLVQLLMRDGISHRADPRRKLVTLETEQQGILGLQEIVWQDEEAAVQFVQSVPVELPADPARLAGLESALLRLNAALPFAGLTLQHETARLYYRHTLPLLPRGGLTTDEVKAGFRLAVGMGAMLTPTLRKLAQGEIEPHQAVAEAQAVHPRVPSTAPSHPPTDTPPVLSDSKDKAPVPPRRTSKRPPGMPVE